MEDNQIIEMYWQRNESAIHESKIKYGSYCSTIAYNILYSKEDVKECVSDTWFKAWNTMPPEKPHRLSVFLGKITRNLAIDRYRKNRTQKYGRGQVNLCLEELSEIIGESSLIEDRLVYRETINAFVSSLPDKNREIFLLRYWYLMSVKDISKRYEMSEGAVKMLLQRIREKLRICLEKEGVSV